VTLGLVSTLVAALCYGFGSILQAMAAARGSAGTGLDLMLVARLIGQWRYLCGLAVDLVAFGAMVVALRTLPLFVVQAAVASSVGVTAVGAHYVLGTTFERRERVALTVLIAGLILLGIAGRPEHAARLGEPGPALVLASAAVVAVLGAGLARSGRAAAALAAVAGASFGAVGIAARAFEVPHRLVDLAGNPLAYAIVAHGILGAVLFAAALQRGAVTTVAAITFAVETVVPAGVGLTVLGDHARPGLLPLALVGFVLTVTASIGLAGHADPASLTLRSSDLR
jgi:hypothetical protein